MTAYRIRYVKPTIGPWVEIEADSMADALNTKHFDDFPYYAQGIRYRDPLPTGGHQIIHFALFEVEGYGELASRVYYRGIYRRGGAATNPTLRDVANFLGWAHPLEELLADWMLEETWDEASERKSA